MNYPTRYWSDGFLCVGTHLEGRLRAVGLLGKTAQLAELASFDLGKLRLQRRSSSGPIRHCSMHRLGLTIGPPEVGQDGSDERNIRGVVCTRTRQETVHLD